MLLIERPYSRALIDDDGTSAEYSGQYLALWLTLVEGEYSDYKLKEKALRRNEGKN
jgi:hypothetical protein